jgi:class 3 adenylate cyclase
MRSGRTSGTATVLFTDLVGSTELMSRLGDAAFDDLRGEHFARLREAMAACGGEEVKSTGDGLLVTFASVVDGLAAAVSAQQATDRHSRSAPAPIAIRVGLALGEVAFEEGDVFGTPVVEAARLVAAARPGQILATTVVKVVAGSRAGVEFTALGTLDLKGLPDPVPVCEVPWEPLTATLPMPPLLGGAGRIFVGRDDALGRLAQLWKEAAAGERRVALLAGEPGIGKTRLATGLAEVAHAEGTLVLAGRCDEDLGVPFQPFVEALRHYAAHASEPRFGRYGGELTRLVPELAENVRGLAEPLRSDPETERYRLFDAVAAWLADLSAETPVLLVLDDLHWAAKPTLLLLRHVLRSSEPLRLLLVVTYRDSEVGRGHPLSELLADVRRIEGVERFPLTGLDQAAVAAFIEGAAGHALSEEDEALPRAVWAETEGNPFFVAEVLRHLSESGGVEHRDGRWVVTAPVEELGIPEGVRDVVGQRLSRLSEAANRALGLASIVGLEFDPAVVRAAGDLGEEVLFSSLEEAVTARILSEVPGASARYRFAHALVRATLYDEITAARRVALHQRVAEAIEAIHANALDDYLPALALHWSRASAPSAQTARAVDYANRAGDRALAQLAHDEAAAYYRQAIELIDAAEGHAGEERRLELLLALGEAQRRAGDRAYRATLLAAADLAQQQGDIKALARAALANTRGTLMSAVGTVDADRIAVLHAALDALGQDDNQTRARLLATLGLELVWGADLDERTGYSDEALAIARRLGDPATLAHVLICRFYTITEPGTVSDRLADTAELLSVSERLEDPVTRCRAFQLRARVVAEVPDLEEASRRIAAYERIAEELGQPLLGWIGLWYRTGLALVSGEIPEAERLAGRILDAGQRSGQPDATVYWAVHLFDVRRDQGRLAEFEADLAGVVRDFPGLPFLRAYLVLLLCEIDEDARARPIFEEFAADFSAFPVDVGWTRGMAALAEACAHLGDIARAARLSTMLAPYADQFAVVAGALGGALAHHLGVLAGTLSRFDESEAYFAAAAVTHDRINAPAWLARTRLEWARMLLAQGQPGGAERARDFLGQALATARELGLAKVERRAVALLSQTP